MLEIVKLHPSAPQLREVLGGLAKEVGRPLLRYEDELGNGCMYLGERGLGRLFGPVVGFFSPARRYSKSPLKVSGLGMSEPRENYVHLNVQVRKDIRDIAEKHLSQFKLDGTEVYINYLVG